MKQNYVVTDIDELIGFLKNVKEQAPDHVFVTGVTLGGNISAPTKKRQHYSSKLEHAFDPELFVSNGVRALTDGGGFYIAHIPKEHIDPKFLKEKDQ
jgi:hypothetical protein